MIFDTKRAFSYNFQYPFSPSAKFILSVYLQKFLN